MKKFLLWAAPIGGAICLIAAAVVICRSSKLVVKKIYGILDCYDEN